jgi:hypothetical protein
MTDWSLLFVEGTILRAIYVMIRKQKRKGRSDASPPAQLGPTNLKNQKKGNAI